MPAPAQRNPPTSDPNAEVRVAVGRPVAVVEAQLRDFLAVLPPSDTVLPPGDFAAQLQWDAWQNHRRELEAELIEAKKRSALP